MKYYCLMDFDGTLTSNLSNLDIDAKKSLKNYLKSNKMCIISEEPFEILNKWLFYNEIECDIASISSSIIKIDNKIIYNEIDKNIINDIINLFNSSIYTLYGKSLDKSYIFNYQERLEKIYPKDYEIINSLSYNLISLNIVISNTKSLELKDYLTKYDLSYETLGKDKNREILRISINKMNKKSISNYIYNKYNDYKFISITDSIQDKDMFLDTTINVAMKNGDNEIKKIASYITKYGVSDAGAIKMLDDICHF